MFGRCKHKKLGEIKDGYQYCIQCNKAFPVDSVCNHVWKTIEEVIISQHDKPKGKVYVLKCEKCGDLKKVSVSLSDLRHNNEHLSS